MIGDLLLKMTIFFIPFQLGLHFWPSYTRVMGVKVDYLSPTLYLVDLSILLFLLYKNNEVLRSVHFNRKTYLLTSFFLLANIYFSSIPQITIVISLKLLIYLTYFLLLKKEKDLWKKIEVSFLTSLFLVVALEFAQVLKQESLGGLFYWLGERSFSISSYGAVKSSLFNLEFLRPQSTFSHPNSLAGFLLLSIYILQIKKTSAFFRLFVFLGLILTLSKSALLAYLLVFVFKTNFIGILIIFISSSLFQLFLPNSPTYFDFIGSRLGFINNFKQVLKNHWALGSGLGTYVSVVGRSLPGSHLLRENLQPVHNILFLLVSEIGILGSFISCWLLRVYVKMLNVENLKVAISLILITGAFDHYWLTLVQNQLLALLTIVLLL